MNPQQHHSLQQGLAQLPLIAILRGITPDEIEPVADALIDAGFRFIEVPLNSPNAWDSIARLRTHCPEPILIGAGTVLSTEQVSQLAQLGGSLLITPNTNPEVIRAGVDAGLAPFIGCMTPSEAFAAAQAGACALKLFPAARLGPDYFKDLKAVLPAGLPVLAVGGVNVDNMAEWHWAGIGGFGFGSNLYTPGRPATEVGRIAAELVAEWHRLQQRHSQQSGSHD
ncbi:2-dehydro-3-deoxy-6-phosphogalactonate aldolase [Aestuariirhabdus sp. Z084]|uniref:2-dehydro-3-deoxy-6-phosphogalactonate aldolase n=1 Tax=Aestuariirhabdus haliotis TaxID=2918751 RepID=UPI00201B4218|nr:2-dehydro-3-deoxy-6-phosphogalactonate aldolase [Aestuariirhabdus haliotis]MCL6417384.1 2-dehydro-3-deoxy-6-phosphogalactonate aldolase [Aestuariirhabdus haliotis]MCL6421320.1 2-dehydro-3-deoxy-6-phosphogalactonate aldolase [Aestuariirhabdus haliotis]